MPRYTEEQIARANETDLVSFLRARGEKLKKSGKEYYLSLIWMDSAGSWNV